MDKVTEGVTVEISYLLKKLEDRLRENIVSATGNFYGRFPGANDSYYQDDETDSNEINKWFKKPWGQALTLTLFELIFL